MTFYMEVNTNVEDRINPVKQQWRKSSEALLPKNIKNRDCSEEGYDIYPFHSVGSGKINNGYAALADWIIQQKNVRIDGYIGVLWEEVVRALENEFEKRGVKVRWTYLTDIMKADTEIQHMVNPFLGEAKSVWGSKTNLKLVDFFNAQALEKTDIDASYDVNIAIGIGASLLNWQAPVIYLDLPKSEIQYRMRAGSICNFGSHQTAAHKDMYKRFYFVDWVILNQHKQDILNKIEIIGDAQRKDDLNWMLNSDLQAGLQAMSQSVFRVRPWFEAGAWGGHWMQEKIKGLNKEEVNYAWSFELIVPENGIIFESDGYLLEVSFDFLMFAASENVLGKHQPVFGTEFPIRFDFLDTFDGGNLSIQCHPSLDYIRKEFGENITQDETYYILDCKKDAKVYLGFQEDINPDEFKEELLKSQSESKEIDITEFVQVLDAKKHDLFLIPNGTVHSAGADNLVLEISATPYIFTFKMYDWMRLGLDGHPRPINIDHAFNNLKFDRRGEKVKEELISKPSVLSQGVDWQLIHLPTHEEHFYDVHRIEFDTEITIETNAVCHILMLVEGTSIQVVTEDGTSCHFSYAETFVVPAAAKQYKLINTGNQQAKVVNAFVKDSFNFQIK